MHEVLARQLRRVGLTPDAPGASGPWAELLERVSVAYVQHDQDRYTLERSLDISSEEMRELHERLRRHNDELELEVQARTQSLRAAMQKAEAAANAKAAFLANMSHEIRTPLNAIIGFADLLASRAEGDDAGKREDWVGTIRDSARHLLELVNAVLDLSKLDAGKMTVEAVPCEVGPVIAQGVALFQERALEKGISLQVSVADDTPKFARTDPLRLKQIVMNLVGNAVKVTEKGGVLVSVGPVAGGTTPRLRVEVCDTGIGLAAPQIQQLFSPFTQVDASLTRKYGGTGLGLSIARALARALGGDVTVVSQPGKGSTFTLDIPTPAVDAVTPPRPAPTFAPPPLAGAGAPTLTGRRILIVDDNATNVKLFRLTLARAGAQVDTAENGALALDAASRTPFDCILMDVQMPVMDGFTASRLLRQRGFLGPILAVTALSTASDRDQCYAAGCTAFLPKPVNLADLVRTVGALVATDAKRDADSTRAA